MPQPAHPARLSPWDLIPCAAAAGLALALPRILEGLPDPLPTHFNLLGEADGWTPHRSLSWVLFGLPAFIWMLLYLLPLAMVGSDQDPEGRKAASLHPLRGLVATGTLLLAASALALPRFGRAAFWGALALFAALLGLGSVMVVRRSRSLGLEDRSLHTRWGLFDVNAEDPELWVPKRFGLGWTLNFAHPAAWWLLGLLLLPAVLALALPALRAR